MQVGDPRATGSSCSASLNEPYDAASPSKQLTAHRRDHQLHRRRMAASVQSRSSPSMTRAQALPGGFPHLEVTHVREFLRHGPVYICDIAACSGVNHAKVAHTLRLLACNARPLVEH
ncbi:hypothetical protein C8R44DRAFT_885905 [Mycena epipterygia]|nr:hypothetical protein C8R44DRAFT_885905 [Mycena epipterygia]